MAPLEPWEKVLVDTESFLKTEHGEIACVDCHNGEQEAEDKSIAHTDLVARPSERGETCAECHEDTAASFPNSLHASLEGYKTAYEARGGDADHPAFQEAFGNHCASCHTSCGDCHVSQPASVGGGLIDGHVFNQTPSLTRNCTACHGSRIGNEYLGKHEGLQADVHFRQGRMTCTDCHSAEQMHGSAAGEETTHRYAGAEMPACENCHAAVVTGDDDILMHSQHAGQLSCQVCHSVAYSSCDSCHVSLSEETGKPIFKTEGSYLTFMIAQNPIPSEDRPYEYVLVRHVPVDPDSFSFYGEGLMPNFDAVSTWKYTTPHNIQLQTPQNASCNACHENAKFFLTADKIDPNELNANLGVYLESLPSSYP